MTGSRARQSGLSYVEVLVAGVIIAVMLIPAMEAITPALLQSDSQIKRVQRKHALVGIMEEVMSESYSTLEAEAQAVGDPNTASDIYSDAAGASDRRLVYLSGFDGDDADGDGDVFTGTDQGLLWIRVTMQDTDLQLQALLSSQGID